MLCAHIFLARSGLPPATPEQISRYQQSLEEEEQQRQRLELERQQAEGKITGPGAISTPLWPSHSVGS